MRSNSTTYQIFQVAFIVFLMGIVSWLATGWQEQQPMQLGLEQGDALAPTWAEAHLVTSVTAQRSDWTTPATDTKTDLHAL